MLVVPDSGDRYLLAQDKVRFAGDDVAAVAAISEHIAEEALGLIEVEYDYRKTAEKVRRFFEKDAKKVLEIGEYMAGPYDDKASRGAKFRELIWTDPWTWENFDILVNLVASMLPFDDPYEMTDLNAFKILDLLFESDQLKVFTGYLALGAGFYPFHMGEWVEWVPFSVWVDFFVIPSTVTMPLPMCIFDVFVPWGGGCLTAVR